MRIRLFLFYILTTIFFNCGCSNNSTEPSKEIRIIVTSLPKSFNPFLATTIKDISILQHLFNCLTIYNSDCSVDLNIANSVQISENGLIYTFHLKNTFWSDGSLVTAKDFVRSWTSILSPTYEGICSQLLFCIKNGPEARSGKINSEAIGVKAIAPMVLEVTLSHPTPYFLHLIANPLFAPKHKSSELNPNNNFICNGKYKIKSYKEDQYLIFELNKYNSCCKSSSPQFIRFNVVPDIMTQYFMFQQKKTDWVGPPFGPSLSHEITTQLQNVKQFDICGTKFILTNTKHHPISNLNFRKALSKSIDKQTIVDLILQNTAIPAFSLTPKYVYKSTQTKDETYNLSEAQSYLNLFLKETHSKLENISISLSFSGSKIDLNIALFLQQQWQKHLGIKVKISPLEKQIYFKNLKSGAFELTISNWVAVYQDPLAFLELFKYKTGSINGSLNHSNWYNSSYHNILNKSIFTKNPQQREFLLCEAENILLDQLPLFPLYHHKFEFSVNPRIKNYIVSNLGTVNFSNSKIK